MLDKNQQIINQIKKANKILITGYISWNEEVLLSSLSMKLILEKIGKKCDIVLENDDDKNYLKPPLEIFSIFKGFDKIKKSLDNLSDFIISLNLENSQIEKVKYKISEKNLNFYITPSNGYFSQSDVKTKNSPFKYDLIIVLGTPDLDSLGQIYEKATDFFFKTPIINIDNHAANEEFGQVNLIDLNKTSISEIIFDIFNNTDQNYFNSDVFDCLLAGIIYKTKNFKTPVTPQTLSATYNLITLGADKEKIMKQFYRSRDLNVFKLWGRALNNLARLKDKNNLIWTTLSENDFKETETKEGHLSNLIDEIIINIPGIDALIVFYKIKDESNVVIYSQRNINLNKLFENYKPNGNNNFIQIKTKERIQEIKGSVIKRLKEELK
jgi:phosphoesterase RecJ-like protein